MENGAYQEYCRLFRLADTKIKRIESLFGKLAAPAVNELRYAGFHFACSFDPKSDEKAQDELRSAEKHCQKSVYESMEIGVSALLNRVSFFQEEYRLVPFGKVIPDYLKYRRKIIEIQDFIGTTNRRDMEDAWGEIQKHFDELLEIHRIFEAARPELNKILVLWRLSFCISALGLFVAIISKCC